MKDGFHKFKALMAAGEPFKVIINAPTAKAIIEKTATMHRKPHPATTMAISEAMMAKSYEPMDWTPIVISKEGILIDGLMRLCAIILLAEEKPEGVVVLVLFIEEDPIVKKMRNKY